MWWGGEGLVCMCHPLARPPPNVVPTPGAQLIDDKLSWSRDRDDIGWGSFGSPQICVYVCVCYFVVVGVCVCLCFFFVFLVILRIYSFILYLHVFVLFWAFICSKVYSK